jgi:hypothetical protein
MSKIDYRKESPELLQGKPLRWMSSWQKRASNQPERVIAPKDNFIGKELTPSKTACQFLMEGGKKLIPSLRL